jgi:hypothetical protein
MPQPAATQAAARLWTARAGGENNADNAKDKPPRWVRRPPAGSVRRGSHEGMYGNLKNAHNSVTVQNRTHVYLNFFDHKDLGNHLLQ